MNKFAHGNWITFIIYCDQIISEPIFKQLRPCLRLLIFFVADSVSVQLPLIFRLHSMFASCCRWCTMGKSWTTHSGSLIIAISSSGRSTWMPLSFSWTCPLVMSLCCGARGRHCLACVSTMHRVSKVGCLSLMCRWTVASPLDKVAENRIPLCRLSRHLNPLNTLST